MRPSTRKWLFGLAAVVLAFSAAMRVGPLNDQRQEHHLAGAPIPELSELPMMLQPLMAVGRAPVVDYLWMRASKLKDQGRYFDADQLSRIICSLQPRFASVWAFQAWNMAYNISVTLNTPEERWRWVRNGFELLRDKGIKFNPHNMQLYRELSWIFFHKVGDFMDEKHYYYKLQLALMVEDVLGPPPADFVRPGRPRGDFYRNYDFRSLAEAPDKFRVLDDDPGVANLVAGLAEFGFEIDKPGVYLGLLDGLRKDEIQMAGTTPATEANRRHELTSLMSDPDTADARAALEHFWRADRLRTKLRIEPARMVSLQDWLGVSLDLRLAETQALYWANLGLEMAADKRVRVDIHKLNTSRIEFFCLQKMFFRGRLAMSRNAALGEPPLLSPDLRIGEILFDTYVRETGVLEWEQKGKPPVSKDMFGGFVGFTRTVVLRYAERGLRDQAREKYDFLVEFFPDPMYVGGLDPFLMRQYDVDRTNDQLRVATNRVEVLIRKAINLYAYDEDGEAARYLDRAKQVYETHNAGAVSDRMKIQMAFRALIEQQVHTYAGRSYAATYELICSKLRITPLKREPAANTPSN